MFNFNERRIVITGAGGDVGQALAPAFSKLDTEIVACDVAAQISESKISPRHIILTCVTNLKL